MQCMYMGVSINGGAPKFMVYNGTCYLHGCFCVPLNTQPGRVQWGHKNQVSRGGSLHLDPLGCWFPAPLSSQVFNLSVFHVSEIDSDLPQKEDENEKGQGQRKSADEVPHLLEPDTLQAFCGKLEPEETGKINMTVSVQFFF